MDSELDLDSLPSPGSRAIIKNFVSELKRQDAQPEMMITLLQQLYAKVVEDWHDGQDDLKFTQYAELGFLEYQFSLKQHVYEDHGREPIALQRSRIIALIQDDAIDEVIETCIGLTDTRGRTRTRFFFALRDYAVAARREPCLAHANVGARSLMFSSSLRRIKLKVDPALKEELSSPRVTQIFAGPEVTDILSGRSKQTPPSDSNPIIFRAPQDDTHVEAMLTPDNAEHRDMEIERLLRDLATIKTADVQEAYDTVMEDLTNPAIILPKLSIKDMPRRCDSSWVTANEFAALEDFGKDGVAILMHTALQYTVKWETVSKHAYNATTAILQFDSFYANIYWKLGLDPEHELTIETAAKNLRVLVGISFHSHQYDMLPVFFWGIQVFVPRIIFLLDFFDHGLQLAPGGGSTSPLLSPEVDADQANSPAINELDCSRPITSRGLSNIASRFLKNPLSPRISLFVTKTKEAVEQLFRFDHSKKLSKGSPQLEDYGIPEPTPEGIENSDANASVNLRDLRRSTLKGKGLGFTFLKAPMKDRKVAEQVPTCEEQTPVQGPSTISTPDHRQVVIEQEVTDSQPQASDDGLSPPLQPAVARVDGSQDTAAVSSTSEHLLDQAEDQGPRASGSPPSPSNTSLLSKVHNLFQGVREEIKDTRKRKLARSPGTTSPSTPAGPSRPAKQQKSNKENVPEEMNASGSAVAEAKPKDGDRTAEFGSQS